jgi:hypothetical protein
MVAFVFPCPFVPTPAKTREQQLLRSTHSVQISAEDNLDKEAILERFASSRFLKASINGISLITWDISFD